MNADDDQKGDNIAYNVVVNHEEQFSIWPIHTPNPLGWNNVGKSGTKEDCLNYISEIWTDMRPLSLRKRMDAVPPEESRNSL